MRFINYRYDDFVRDYIITLLFILSCCIRRFFILGFILRIGDRLTLIFFVLVFGFVMEQLLCDLLGILAFFIIRISWTILYYTLDTSHLLITQQKQPTYDKQITALSSSSLTQ